MPTIHLPTPLRPSTGGAASVVVPGHTVHEALAALADGYPDLRRHLFDDAGKLRSFVNVYVGEEDVRYLDGDSTPARRRRRALDHPVHRRRSAGRSRRSRPSRPSPTTRSCRYSRHLIMPEVGMEGQKKLKAASVLLIGAGGLGSPLGALPRRRRASGRSGSSTSTWSTSRNLQRQVIYGTSDVGRRKLRGRREPPARREPERHGRSRYDARLTARTPSTLCSDYDIIVDGTDNFPTRYLVNDACVLLGKPNVYGCIFRFEGQASVFYAEEGPCYRCLYPEPPPPGLVPCCAEGGVLGVLPGTVGAIQATETIKLILGIGEPLIGRLLRFDALGMRFREFKLRKDPDCPVCGAHPTRHRADRLRRVLRRRAGAEGDRNRRAGSARSPPTELVADAAGGEDAGAG